MSASTSPSTWELDRAHVFHSWSAQADLDPMVLIGAEGTVVQDDAGERYLDFSSQLVYTNLGHAHPKVVAAVQQQAARLCTVAPQHANEQRSEAARLIAGRAPDGLDKVFFTNGGADANEHAVRMARLHTGRPKVLSTYRSYHGGTQTAINITGDPRRFRNDTASAGIVHFFGPYLYRSEFHATTADEEAERAVLHLRRTVEAEGPTTIAAIILETIPGTAGVLLPPPGYLTGVRELCDEHGIALIADEVMAGFGRAGSWLAIDRYELRPDLITFAKGVNSGYVPMGGVIINAAIAATFDQEPYPGGLTYSGHPLAAAAVVATLTAMDEEGVVEHAESVGRELFRPGLDELASRHPSIGEARGVGVFWAVELVQDRTTREPMPTRVVSDVAAACKEAGLLVLAPSNRIHLVPPCNVTGPEVEEAIDILDRALTNADLHTHG